MGKKGRESMVMYVDKIPPLKKKKLHCNYISFLLLFFIIFKVMFQCTSHLHLLWTSLSKLAKIQNEQEESMQVSKLNCHILMPARSLFFLPLTRIKDWQNIPSWASVLLMFAMIALPTSCTFPACFIAEISPWWSAAVVERRRKKGLGKEGCFSWHPDSIAASPLVKWRDKTECIRQWGKRDK